MSDDRVCCGYSLGSYGQSRECLGTGVWTLAKWTDVCFPQRLQADWRDREIDPRRVDSKSAAERKNDREGKVRQRQTVPLLTALSHPLTFSSLYFSLSEQTLNYCLQLAPTGLRFPILWPAAVSPEAGLALTPSAQNRQLLMVDFWVFECTYDFVFASVSRRGLFISLLCFPVVKVAAAQVSTTISPLLMMVD